MPKSELYKKLALVQKEMKPVKKDSENPHFHNKYFDINSLLGELKPLLNKVGLVVLQPLCDLGGMAAIQTIIADPETGETLESTVPLPPTTDAQKMGGAISYLRRYALTSLFSLEGEDDDGNTASGHSSQEIRTVPIPEQTPGIGMICPKCSKLHYGKFPKCIECWKAAQPADKLRPKSVVKEAPVIDGVPF